MTDVGLVLVRGGSADDRFVAALVRGFEETIVSSGLRLTTMVVADRRAELAAYRHWSRSAVADVVVLMDARAGDERLKLLRKLELPVVELVDAERADDASAVVFDTSAMAEVLLRYLSDAGYTRVVYLAGPSSAAARRGAALVAGAEAAGVRVDRSIGSVAEALEAARAASSSGPAAIIANDDVTAVATIAALVDAGSRVPRDIGVLSWTDSVVCQSSDPPITALDARANEVGALLGECLLGTVRSGDRIRLAAPPPFVVGRASA